MKLLTWNIKGLNSPQKRKRVFHYLEKNPADIICLQESRLRSKDVRLVKNKKLGKEYTSSIEKSKRGVIIYVKNHLESREIFKDKNGFYLGVVNWGRERILILGIYGPQDKKGKFFKKLQGKLFEYEYDNIIALGDLMVS